MTRASLMSIPWKTVGRWAAACAAGFTFGQTTGVIAGFLVGGAVAQVLGEAAASLAAFITLGAVTGAIIGLAQRWIMRDEIELTRRWILVSTLGWTAGYLVASLSSPLTAAAFGDLVSGAVSWVLLGATVGLAQWQTLRQLVLRAGGWVPANIIGWLLGPPVAALGMSLAVSFGVNPADSIGVMLASALTGATAGAVTGIVLGGLMRNQISSA